MLSSSLYTSYVFLKCEENEENKKAYLSLKEPVKEQIYQIKSDLNGTFIKNSNIDACFDHSKSSPYIIIY